jgi:malonyl-CoA O-methyltransferase
MQGLGQRPASQDAVPDPGRGRRRLSGGMASIYCRPMSETSAPRPATDVRALAHVLGRLARAEDAPWLHQEVARRMAERLPVILRPPETWLDWWGFTGAGAAVVQAVWPQARRSVAEPTPALVARSRAALRAPWWSLGQRRQRADQAVALSADQPAGQAQMLWSNLTLHTSPDPATTLALWHRALAVDGFVMFSTFGPDTLRELRAVFAAQGWPAPHPPYTDMHDLGDLLVHGGFADPVMDQEMLELTWSSPETLLAELRSLGGHLGLGRFAGLRTPRWRARLLQALGALADDQGRIRMRFELVYGHAYKPAPRPSRDGTATVSLAALRAKLPKPAP